MTTAESLKQIADRLTTIEMQLAARGVLIDVTQAIDDNLNAFGLIAQLVEIHKAQSEARQIQADAIIAQLTGIEAALIALRDEIHGVTPEDVAALRVVELLTKG